VALAASDGGFGFVVGLTFAFGGAFVPVLLAFGEGDLALHTAVLEVKTDRDQRDALLAGEGVELFDLFPVEQELTGACLLVVHDVAVGEVADVHVQQEGFAVLEQTVGVFEVRFAFADALDLGAAEGDAGLEFVGKEVVETGGTIERGVASAGGYGVAVFGLGRRFSLGRRRGRVGK